MAKELALILEIMNGALLPANTNDMGCILLVPSLAKGISLHPKCISALLTKSIYHAIEPFYIIA